MNTDPEYTAAEGALLMLRDYRARQGDFGITGAYDERMEAMRRRADTKMDTLRDPLKLVAKRLFVVLDQAFFLIEVSKWKIDYLADVLIHAIEARNPLALATNTRALIEHIAAYSSLIKQQRKLEESLRGQSSEAKIDAALGRTEKFLSRAYYGSSASNDQDAPSPIHINDYLKDLKADVRDIGEVYDYLCEYVHPNYGSNLLVSTGQLGSGQLNPPESVHRETLDRMRRYCSLTMIYLRDRSIDHAAVFVRLDGLLEFCLVPGAKLNNVFAKREARPEGDGKTKETAYHFPKARTVAEANEMSHRFLRQKKYMVKLKEIGGVEDKHIYDLYRTTRGDVWFRVPKLPLTDRTKPS